MLPRIWTAAIVAMLTITLAACGKNQNGQKAEKGGVLAAQRTFENPPNVVLIMASSLGYGDVSINAGGRLLTPNIDRIAKDGVLFTTGYAVSSARGPSRAGLFTGRNPSRNGFEYDNGPGSRDDEKNLGLPTDEVLLSDVLHERKYHTGFIGSWNLGSLKPYTPTSRGYDEFYGITDGDAGYFDAGQKDVAFAQTQSFQQPPVTTRYTQLVKGDDAHPVNTGNRYLTTDFGDQAVDFIDRNGQGRFFLTVAFNAPHQPLQAPKALVDKMLSIPEPRQKIYAAMIASLDENVGKILGAIDNRGLTRNTIVIFVSDTGCDVESGACPCEGLHGGAPTLYDGGLRVPMMIKWPDKIKPGTRYTKPVSLMDITPTVIVATDAARPAGKKFDGVDLLPYVEGKKKTRPHETLVWLRRPAAAIRYRDWKLIVDSENAQSQLFDLAADPAERNDLSKKRSDMIGEMRAQLEIDRSIATDPRWLSREKAKLEFCNETMNIYR